MRKRARTDLCGAISDGRQAPRICVSGILAHGQAHTLPAFSPFQVVRAFWVMFGLAVDDDQIGLDAAVWRQDNRTVAQTFPGLDAFGEVDFFALGVRHG
jgi:hypothetical protein